MVANRRQKLRLFLSEEAIVSLIESLEGMLEGEVAKVNIESPDVLEPIVCLIKEDF